MMAYLQDWRSRIADELPLFGRLLTDNQQLNVAYGVIAGALLWPVRDDLSSPELVGALRSIYGAQDLQPVIRAASLLQHVDRSNGAQMLARATEDDQGLRALLDRLLEYFRDEWLNRGLLQPTISDIDISGDVQGANVVIGGTQYVAGDFVISQTIVREPVRSCPAAPPPPSHFAGRRAELNELKAALSSGGTVAITGLQGMGGIGKTAVALQVASELKDFGSVLWASLGPQPSAAGQLISWGRYADPDFQMGTSSPDMLVDRVRALLTDLVRDRCHGRVLVILDDVWEGESVRTARLLQRAAPSDSAILITTRSQKVVAQLRSIRVELRPMTPEDSVRMLRNLLYRFGAIGDSELLSLAEVVGFHPLAMELAAGQVSLLERPEMEIGDLVEQYQGGLPAGSPFRDIHLELGEDREDNLELVLSFSYAALDEAQKRHFRALGVLAYSAPFDRRLCEAIWRTEAKPELDELRHRALIGIADEPGWYVQHPLLRAYAKALLRSADEATFRDAQDAYTDYILTLTKDFRARTPAAWQHLEPYIPHVEEVGSILTLSTRSELQGTSPDPQRIERALDFALDTRPLLSSRREIAHSEWLEMGLDLSRHRGEPRYTTLFLNGLGSDSFFRGDSRKAVQFWHDGLQVAERARDSAAMAEVLTSLGLFYLLSDPMEAPEYLRRAMAIYKDAGNDSGYVRASILLAESHASRHESFDEREAGLPILERAIESSEKAGLEIEAAEAKLRLGRLCETLGDRKHGIELITDTVQVFERNKRRDLEAQAHLFLGSGLANIHRLEDAGTHLHKALPLFKRIGDRPGQAVVLRNLGELSGVQERPEEALTYFAAAVPLVLCQTMRFLDEDSTERGVAPEFFGAQYEEVNKLDLVEQFRARALQQLREERGEEDKYDGGLLPDEVLRYFITKTIRVRYEAADPREAWVRALSKFSQDLAALGSKFAAHAQFASALKAVTESRAGNLPQENQYTSHMEYLSARLSIEKTSAEGPLFPQEQTRSYIQNTLAVLVSEPEHEREWTTELRRLRRNCHAWGDRQEEAFVAALLAVIGRRLISLPSDNPYCDALRELQNSLSRFEHQPLDNLVGGAVAVLNGGPQARELWLDYLENARRDAERHGEPEEEAFISVLIKVAEHRPYELPKENRYRSELHRVQDAIDHVSEAFAPLPEMVIANYVQRTVSARTTEPKTIDALWQELDRRERMAVQQGRTRDAAFFSALQSVLYGERFGSAVPEIYVPWIEAAVESIQEGTLTPAAEVTMPQQQIQEMTDAVSEASTRSPERLDTVRKWLEAYSYVLNGRNRDWDNERAFVEVLIEILAPQEKSKRRPLEQSNPYDRYYRQIIEQIDTYQRIHSKGGKFAPQELEGLLSRTAECIDAPIRILKAKFDSKEGLHDLLGGNLQDLVIEQKTWQETLISLRDEFENERPEWRFEIELLNALIATLDTQPVALSLENPYQVSFQRMLDGIEYRPGLPKDRQIRALASSEEEYAAHFRGLFTGRDVFLRAIDNIVSNVVIAKTLFPDFLQKSAAMIARLQDTLNEGAKQKLGSSEHELDLLLALQKVLKGEAPQLGSDHAYSNYLCQTIESILVFEGKSDLPHALTGEQIKRLYFMVTGVLTFDHEHYDQYKTELEQISHRLHQIGSGAKNEADFVDALLIVLSERPAEVPVQNPYRPYLTSVQAQIRALQANKSRSDSVQVRGAGPK